MPNKTKKELRIFFASLSFLFFVMQVSALDITVQSGEDFIINETETFTFLQHEGPYTVCSGTQRAIPILVTNKASAITRYTFSLDGEKWTVLSGNAMTLQPEQQGILYISLFPSRTEGNFTINFNVVNEITRIKSTYPIQTVVEECYSIGIELPKEKDSICSCEPTSYDAVIKNNGKFTETINITLGMANWTNLSRSSVTLGPNGRATVKLNVNPDCDADGSYSIKISSFLPKHDSIKADALLDLDITRKMDCYRADIIAKDISSDYSGAIVPIKVRNKGIKPATYAISLDAPNWIQVIPSSVAINPGKKATIILTAKPTEQAAADGYATTIRLSLDDIEYKKTINVKLGEKSELFKKLSYYRYYIYSMIILIFVFILAYKPIKKKIKKYRTTPERIRRKIEAIEKKAAEKKKTKKKSRKKLLRLFYYLFISAIALAGIAYPLVYYDLFSYVKDFLITYYQYIAAGIVILAVLILAMKFYKPIIDFLMQKDKKK